MNQEVKVSFYLKKNDTKNPVAIEGLTSIRPENIKQYTRVL